MIHGPAHSGQAPATPALAVVRGQRDGYVRDLQRLKRTRDGIDNAIRCKKAQIEVMNEAIRALQK